MCFDDGFDGFHVITPFLLPSFLPWSDPRQGQGRANILGLQLDRHIHRTDNLWPGPPVLMYSLRRNWDMASSGDCYWSRPSRLTSLQDLETYIYRHHHPRCTS